MKLVSIVCLYGVRLRARIVLVQEVFAVLGISVGVALLLASQIASTSLNSSVRQLTSELVGGMQLQLDTRSAQGFDQRLMGEVERLPGVRAALPVLEAPANIVGPSGQQAVDLIGTDPSLVRESSPLLRHFSYGTLAKQEALALPTPLAEAIGARVLEPIKLDVAGREVTTLVGVALNGRAIGTLVHSPVAIAPLAYAQSLTGNRGRLTRIFVQAAAGEEPKVRAGLERIAAGHLNVEPADWDATLFRVAAAPANQGEGLFSGISALVGFLCAANAMLLTIGLRQDLVRSLRSEGASRWATIKTLLFDALVLGVLASAIGLALGDVLSVVVFRSNPGYLSFAFPVSSQRVLTWQSFAIAAGAGILAACIGVLAPIREIWSIAQTARSRARSVRSWLTVASLTGGIACLAITTIILLGAPQSAVLGSVTLVASLLFLLPLLLHVIISAFDRVQRLRWVGRTLGASSTELAICELRSPVTRARSIAIAATGAIAVFGSVAIQGAHANLQHGLDRLFGDVTSTTDLWVAPPGPQNLLGTAPFQATIEPTLAHLPGVQSVDLYRAGFLNYGARRVWVLAPPGNAPIPPSQLTTGNLTTATKRLKEGGWAVISEALATQHHLRIGDKFSLPAPNPVALRVAALTTNLGWPPGAIILDPRDYISAWGTNPTAYNIALRASVTPQQGQREVQQALGPNAGLTVQTSRQRDQLQQAASRQGLSRLTQIATLVLIATVLAMSLAMATMIWQRRPTIARIKVDGYETNTLWLSLIYESSILLGAGCSIGAAFGIYGQLLISHALATITGFPVIYSIGALAAITSFALVSVLAVAIVAIPGHKAASTKPYL